MNRGLAVPISFKLLTSAEKHTEDSIKLANILGWCIELVSIEKGLLKLGITCMNRFVIKWRILRKLFLNIPHIFYNLQMQTFFLVADDIMDGSETRRGKVCWYKKDNIGMMAFNDAIILEHCIYSILNRHFKHHKHYTTIVDAFLQVRH